MDRGCMQIGGRMQLGGVQLGGSMSVQVGGGRALCESLERHVEEAVDPMSACM